MTREIKFRVWDGKTMRVLDNVLVGVGQIGFSDSHYVDLGDHDHEEVQLMQYTGLRDKNGTEIYEGDIFQPYTFERDGRRKEKPSGRPFAIQYEELGNCGCCTDDSGIGFNFHCITYGAVIGNIYENPGFLEQTS